jgi:hypothetical protein
MDRLACRAIPYDPLALVGDADCGESRGLAPTLPSASTASHLAGEDFHWIVFNPSLLRIELREFLLCHGRNSARMIKEDGARTGGADPAKGRDSDSRFRLKSNMTGCVGELGGSVRLARWKATRRWGPQKL